MCTNAHALFLYDRMEYSMANAYGTSTSYSVQDSTLQYKLLLNPLMVLRPHQDCLNSHHPTVKLKSMFDLSRYIEHLMDHDDVGTALLKRTEVIAHNPFATREELDSICHLLTNCNHIL